MRLFLGKCAHKYLPNFKKLAYLYFFKVDLTICGEVCLTWFFLAFVLQQSFYTCDAAVVIFPSGMPKDKH